MKLKLEVNVEYQPNRVPEAVLRTLLQRAAEHLANEGLLTGDTAATVERLCVDVTRIEPAACPSGGCAKPPPANSNPHSHAQVPSHLHF